MFTIREGSFYPTYVDGNTQTTDKLPPGEYTLCEMETMFFSSPYFKPRPKREGLVELEGTPFTGIKNRLNSFFTPETLQLYRDIEARHFIGCLLYGPPGTGKTCFVQTVCQNLIKSKGAVVLIVEQANHLHKLASLIDMMREGDVSRMVIVVVEELDKLIMSGWQTAAFMEKIIIDFCDGGKTPDNVLLMCSTNHIDKIPDSLKQRPSRFAIVEEIDAIPEAIAKQIVNRFVPEKYRSKVDIAKLSYMVTDQKVRIDQIKYIILNILTSGMKIKEAIYHATKEHAPKVIMAAKSSEQEGDETDDNEE